MGETIRNTSQHSEELGDGRSVERGGFALDVDLDNEVNRRLLDEGRIIRASEPEDPPKLTGAALHARAKALGIESKNLSADELRDKIAEQEEAQ
jgi:hypothetical protein